MTNKYFFASLTRISNLPEVSFSVQPLPREEWETGDYVVGEVDAPPSDLSRIELNNGRNVEEYSNAIVHGCIIPDDGGVEASVRKEAVAEDPFVSFEKCAEVPYEAFRGSESQRRGTSLRSRGPCYTGSRDMFDEELNQRAQPAGGPFLGPSSKEVVSI